MLNELQQRVEERIKSNPALAQFKNQMLIDMTAEGLRIQIVDEQNRPMFDSGAADVKPYTREILREIAALLNEVPNRISISGHTDAKPFSSGERGYSNWELSSDRANACRRELIGGGIKVFAVWQYWQVMNSFCQKTKFLMKIFYHCLKNTFSL